MKKGRREEPSRRPCRRFTPCCPHSHARRAGPASAAADPRMASPGVTLAPGQSCRISLSLRPRPLPSWVQKGRMVLPVKSKRSRKVYTGMGMVPQ